MNTTILITRDQSQHSNPIIKEWQTPSVPEICPRMKNLTFLTELDIYCDRQVIIKKTKRYYKSL